MEEYAMLASIMDHDNQWSLAYTGIVDVYAIIFRIMMCHVLVDVAWNN
jgi:hypothetical protein